ncbi:MAG: DoxX family protein [Actinobacteria bacterium]|nr:DoxX family protein [Actinomycetota bacterium]
MSTATLPATTASDDAPVSDKPVADRIPRESDLVHTKAGRAALAVLRLATGWIFLWAFLDKTFGLGFSTPIDRAWINGGTPSQGFLLGDSVAGPLKPFFAAIASPASDILFMAGMLGIGAAVMLGIGLRISAVAGTIILVLMYLAEWPFIADSGSTNPAVDYHIIYALALIVIATLGAGDTFGLGRPWRHLVRRAPWLA